MAKEEDQSDIVEVQSSGAKSARELEAEISATVSSLGEPKKKRKKAGAATSKPAPKSKPAAKTAKPKAVKRPPEVIKPKNRVPINKASGAIPSDVRPAPKSVPKVSRPKIQTASKPQPSAVKVNVGAPAKAAAKKVASDPKTVVLSPKSKKVAKARPKPIPAVVKQEAPKVQPIESPRAPAEKPAPAPVSPAPKPQKPKSTTGKLHAARIYDTTSYHLPLSVDHHHRRAVLPFWGQVAAVAAAIGVVLIAAVYL